MGILGCDSETKNFPNGGSVTTIKRKYRDGTNLKLTGVRMDVLQLL